MQNISFIILFTLTLFFPSVSVACWSDYECHSCYVGEVAKCVKPRYAGGQGSCVCIKSRVSSSKPRVNYNLNAQSPGPTLDPGTAYLRGLGNAPVSRAGAVWQGYRQGQEARARQLQNELLRQQIIAQKLRNAQNRRQRKVVAPPITKAKNSPRKIAKRNQGYKLNSGPGRDWKPLYGKPGVYIKETKAINSTNPEYFYDIQGYRKEESEVVIKKGCEQMKSSLKDKNYSFSRIHVRLVASGLSYRECR
jgi:type II secretory pathway pseudopilin PulG